MERKTDLSKAKIKITNIDCFQDSKYNIMKKIWQSNIGFGQYTIRFDDINNTIEADSEHMDINEDKEFLRKILDELIERVNIIS